MGHREAGGDAGNQKHITTDGIVYNKDAGHPFLGKAEDEYKLHLEDLKSAKNSHDAADILPNVAIYSPGRQRTWEYKNGELSKIVHADGQVWTRQDKKHWNISYHGKLIGKNVELSNVKIENDKTKENYKTLTWTVGGVKKTLSGSGEFIDPSLKSLKAKHEQAKEDDHQDEKKSKEENAKDDKSAKQLSDSIDTAIANPPMLDMEVHHLMNHEQKGEASWYGPGFHGKRTASGERYNMHKPTCAHKTLPFGTKLLVEANGRKTVVTVTDRGPFYGNRVLDLSMHAAQKLDMIRQGHTVVSYRAI